MFETDSRYKPSFGDTKPDTTTQLRLTAIYAPPALCQLKSRRSMLFPRSPFLGSASELTIRELIGSVNTSVSRYLSLVGLPLCLVVRLCGLSSLPSSTTEA